MNKTALTSARYASIESASRQGFALTRFKSGEVIARQVCPGGRVLVKAWRAGLSGSPAFFYSFRSLDRAELYVREWLASQALSRQARATRDAERKAKRAAFKASDFWAVGDVGHTFWGYDQTNVEFFQVVRLLPRSVVVRQVAENNSDHGQPGGGRTQPRRFEFVGPEQLCPIDEHGNFNAGPCYDKPRPIFRHHVSKWTGKSVHTSSDR